MSCDSRCSRTRGFTLIELVIAVTILGILTTVVFSGLRTGLRIWTRGNTAIDGIQASRTSLSLLRDQIQGALPMLVFPNVDTAPKLSFGGDQSSLRFVSRTSFRDGPDAPPHWIELSWAPNADSGRLTAKEFLVLSPGNAPATEPFWKGDVLEGKNFRFEYLARRLPGTPVVWATDWPESRLQLPAAVRVKFERAGRLNQILLPLEYAENSWSDQWFR